MKKWYDCYNGMYENENVINGFCGKNSFLSNFFPCPIERNGKIYKSLESAYQASKYDSLPYIQNLFINASAYEAKKLSKENIYNYAEFDSRKVIIMKELLRKKFFETNLSPLLKNTGKKTLIEYNWWNDTFWGVTNKGGHNFLGVCLMEVRTELNKKNNV